MFPDLEVVSNDQNLGFAAAANQACKHTASRWLTIVNPDVGCCGVPAVHADGTVNDRSFFVRPTLWSEITLSFAVHQFARASRFLNRAVHRLPALQCAG
jgi:hypothetical protein